MRRAARNESVVARPKLVGLAVEVKRQLSADDIERLVHLVVNVQRRAIAGTLYDAQLGDCLIALARELERDAFTEVHVRRRIGAHDARLGPRLLRLRRARTCAEQQGANQNNCSHTSSPWSDQPVGSE